MSQDCREDKIGVRTAMHTALSSLGRKGGDRNLTHPYIVKQQYISERETSVKNVSSEYTVKNISQHHEHI